MPMRLFVSEYLCGGAWPEPNLNGTLAREGRAMLLAILEDLSRIENVAVVTTWDQRLGRPPSHLARVQIAAGAVEERRLFARLVETTDATFLIAPEFGDILAGRIQTVESRGKPIVGSSSAAVRRCADKLELSRHLKSRCLATIDTWNLEPESGWRDAIRFPAVMKPRYGAGSQETYRVASEESLAGICDHVDRDSLLRERIVQPFLSGRPISVALIMEEAGNCRHVFPPAEQILSADGRFRYLGGLVPATVPDQTAVAELAARACRSIAGLRGYVGVDLILPDETPHRPVVVEINPRLTTSYLGYRGLTDDNLAARMLSREQADQPISWGTEEVSFTAEGSCPRKFHHGGRHGDSRRFTEIFRAFSPTGKPHWQTL